jgi:predicted AAA+ superfamily ATPase
MNFRGTRLIKVITGIRRCGKSTLFGLYQEELRKSGVMEQQITHINFEDMAFELSGSVQACDGSPSAGPDELRLSG